MKHKILIIDDEEMILTMLKKCLEAENFLVYTADNAKKALELMSVAPDIILCPRTYIMPYYIFDCKGIRAGCDTRAVSWR